MSTHMMSEQSLHAQAFGESSTLVLQYPVAAHPTADTSSESQIAYNPAAARSAVSPVEPTTMNALRRFQLSGTNSFIYSKNGAHAHVHVARRVKSPLLARRHAPFGSGPSRSESHLVG